MAVSESTIPNDPICANPLSKIQEASGVQVTSPIISNNTACLTLSAVVRIYKTIHMAHHVKLVAKPANFAGLQ